MIHIIFQQDDKEVLEKAMELDDSLSGEIVEIKDEWGVGPLAGLDTDEGWNARVEWWREMLKGSPYSETVAGSFDDRETVKELIAKLDSDETEQAWLWMGPNQHDVTGYYWLMPQLKKFQGRLMIIYLNNLPFINEKGQLFYPWAVQDILPKEAVKAKKLARPVTISEFEIDPDEWKRIAEENAAVRILEGGKKIAGKSEDFYDNEILKNISPEWQKATRALMNILHRMKIKTGDLYLMARMKFLINQGRIEAAGDTDKSWRDFDVRLPGKKETESVADENSEKY
jgi:hypothetical protein